jgi:predicted metal-dependent phosphoesterase TrpH
MDNVDVAGLYVGMHIYTDHSADAFTPKEVIECASKVEVCRKSITDHDCVE